MLLRGETSMVSLPDASRRLQVPVDILWQWVSDGKLSAEIKPGRGLGMEYYLDASQLKRAAELRTAELPPLDDEFDGNGPSGAPNNVISLPFSDGRPSRADSTPTRTEVIAVLENLRSDAIAAMERQAGREVAIGELATAVESLMGTIIEAMDRTQDRSQGRLVAELESLRARLARQIQDREQEDLRLRDHLVATKTELGAALEAMRLGLGLSVPGESGNGAAGK